MAVEIARRHFSVHDYYRMAEAGILREDDRVELIEGEIVEMPPIGSQHSSVTLRLHTLLSRLLSPDRALILVQDAVRLSDTSEPQPDIALLRPRSDFYSGEHPGPGDVLLLIEVADSSLAYDRNIKLPLYARSGIAEVWIVDLATETVHVHREPTGDSYRASASVSRDGSIAPAAFPDLNLNVDEVFG
jgi:Uma2 family endonuclease